MSSAPNPARIALASVARRLSNIGRLRISKPVKPVGFREQLTFLLVLSLTPFLLLALINANRAYDTYRKQLEQGVTLTAELIAAREQLLLQQTYAFLRTVASQADALSNGAGACEINIQPPGHLGKSLVGFQAIDPTGKTVCSHGNDLALDLSPERYAIRRNSTLVSLVADTGPGKQPLGLVSVPWIDAATHQTQGQLLAVLDGGALRSATDGLSFPPQTSIALIDVEGHGLPLAGDSMTDLNWLPAQPLMPLAGQPMAKSLIAKDGNERLYIVRRIGTSEMLLVAAAPIASVRDMALFVLLSGIAGSLLMLCLMLAAIWWLFHHFVTRPVSSLERTFLAYANGNLSVRARPQSHAAREIRSLAVSFNKMAQSFAEINQSLVHAAARERALRRELHHRVNNNMQIILGLLNLEVRSATRAEDISQLNSLIQRVLAIAIVHRRFYEGLRTDMIDFTTSLEDLLERLKSQENASPPVRRLRLVAVSCELPIDQAVPLALLVCEWIRVLNHIEADESVEPILQLGMDTESGLVNMQLKGIESLPARDYDAAEDVSQKLVNVLRRQLDHQNRNQANSLWEIWFRTRGSSGF